MPTPRPVSKRLREMLGEETAEPMVDYLDGLELFDAKMAQRNADLMKWALGFWLASFVGIIGAIITLGRFPR